MSWKILDTGERSAEENMLLDAKLLENLSDEPILHLYDWKGDCATYGVLVKPEEFLNLKGVAKRRLNLAKRPTGGGIIFHVWDLAFSVLVPSSSSHFSTNTLENYDFVNSAVSRAIKSFSKKEVLLTPVDGVAKDSRSERFCMATPTKYDVMIDGRKVAGAAQRRRKQGYLHQGTISLVLPPKEYMDDVLLPSKVYEGMQEQTYCLLGKSATQSELSEARNELKHLLKRELCQP